MGLAYNGKQEHDKVIEYSRKAIELKPDLVEAYNNIGLSGESEFRQHTLNPPRNER
jgi:hypothetical protein